MKYTIHGYSQRTAMELGLDNDALLLLRWISDFSNTSKMEHIEVKGKIYYWVNYKTVCEELPILVTKKDTLYRKLKKLCEAKVLKHHTVKNNGTYSYYAFDKVYEALISEDFIGGYGKKSVGGTESFPEGVRKKIRTKDSSIRLNSSTKTTTDHEPENIVVVPSPELIDSLYKEIKDIVGATITKKRIKEMISIRGETEIRRYLKNWDKFTAPKTNKAGFFIQAVLEQYPVPEQDKGSNCGGFEEHGFTEEQFESCYENSKW